MYEFPKRSGLLVAPFLFSEGYELAGERPHGLAREGLRLSAVASMEYDLPIKMIDTPIILIYLPATAHFAWLPRGT